MDFQIMSYAIAAMMVIFVIVLLYGAVVTWKAKSKFIGFVFFMLAIAVGVFTYSVYGKMIMALIGLK